MKNKRAHHALCIWVFFRMGLEDGSRSLDSLLVRISHGLPNPSRILIYAHSLYNVTYNLIIFGVVFAKES